MTLADDDAEEAKVAAARQASFEEAQRLGSELAEILSNSCSSGEPMPDVAVNALRALVSHIAGGRGWFVSLLTNPDYEPIFVPPLDEGLLSAIEASPDPNAKLMTMNVAMSTATELVHQANCKPHLAAASRLTRERSKALAVALIDRMPALRASIEALKQAVQPLAVGDGETRRATSVEPEIAEWHEFCRKWGYGPEQRGAIRTELEEILAKV